MKMGLWDSLYDTFQEVNKQDSRKTETAYVSGVIDVGLSKAAEPVPSVKEESDTLVSENGKLSKLADISKLTMQMHFMVLNMIKSMFLDLPFQGSWSMDLPDFEKPGYNGFL